MRTRTLLLTWLACLAAAPAASSQTVQSQTVVELFTSQGCSSCPAADALLKTYTERPGFIALSFSVDYWDHLGWKDTLASPKNSARQKSYAKALGTGNVYTPQLVINGAAQVIGSNKVEIEKAVAKLRKDQAGGPVTVAAANDGKRVTIEIAAGATGVGATVWLAVVSPLVEVDIKRGENRGRTIAYHNVVREISPVGMWSGQAMRIELPANAVMKDGDRCAVMLQADNGGRILGAAWMTP